MPLGCELARLHTQRKCVAAGLGRTGRENKNKSGNREAARWRGTGEKSPLAIVSANYFIFWPSSKDGRVKIATTRKKSTGKIKFWKDSPAVFFVRTNGRWTRTERSAINWQYSIVNAII